MADPQGPPPVSPPCLQAGLFTRWCPRAAYLPLGPSQARAGAASPCSNTHLAPPRLLPTPQVMHGSSLHPQLGTSFWWVTCILCLPRAHEKSVNAPCLAPITFWGPLLCIKTVEPTGWEHIDHSAPSAAQQGADITGNSAETSAQAHRWIK